MIDICEIKDENGKRVVIKDPYNHKIIYDGGNECNFKTVIERAVKDGINLSFINLMGVDLSNANLKYGVFKNANLSKCRLINADLTGADLRGARLYDADLSLAVLVSADLSDSNMASTKLCGAYFSNTSLSDSYMSSCDMKGAWFEFKNINNSFIKGIDFNDVNHMKHIPMACPTDGEFIGWKKVNNMLVKLKIPEDAKRSSSTSNKCRCDKALVLGITDLYGNNPIDEIINTNTNQLTVYKVGEMVYPDGFDDNRYNECSHGIHFFIDKRCAIDY